MTPDWERWHDRYDDPESLLSRRLRIVQAHLFRALDEVPAGPIRLISMCAGQAHDVLGVLPRHPRGNDVSARLVELDDRNVEHVKAGIQKAQLDHVEVIRSDAGITDSYEGAVPAQIILACGIFGNVTDASITRTIETLPELCDSGAFVIWTRHRLPPDSTPMIRTHFADHGFGEWAFDAGPDIYPIAVGFHRFEGERRPFEPGRRMFTFDDDVINTHLRNDQN
jgi:hypothetical protein